MRAVALIEGTGVALEWDIKGAELKAGFLQGVSGWWLSTESEPKLMRPLLGTKPVEWNAAGSGFADL